MMQKTLIATLIICCLLLLPLLAHAQAPSPVGLDILFVVDQSGSMGGNPEHPTPNDPNQLRFYAPIHAMRWLGSDRLQVHTTATFRMAVLHFGDRLETGLDWQTIAPSDTLGWEAQKAQLEQALAFESLRASNLGGTNFLQALQQGRQMFNQLPPDPAGPHLKAIIVLTDGEPSVPGQTPEEHMRQVQRYVAINFPADQFTMCVIAMNDVSSNYWTRMQPFWETITRGCAVKIVSNESDVGAAFRDILRQLTQPLARPYSTQIEDVPLGIPTTLVVPPYLQSIAFTLDKAEPEKDDIIIEVLEGAPIGFGTSQVQTEGQNEPIETITIYDPPPGRWRIKATEGATLQKVDMRKILANSVLLAPANTIPLKIPAQIKYQVQSSQGRPLPQYTDPRYALQVKAEVAADGQTWPLTMVYDTAQNFYSADFTPSRSGRHSVRLSAVTHDIDGREVIVFPSSEVGSFEVSSPQLVLQGEWPSTQPLFEPRPLAYKVDMAGQASLSGLAIFSSGSQSWNVPLTLSSDNILRGELLPVTAGAYQGVITLYITGGGGQHEEIYQETVPAFSVIAPAVTMQAADLVQHCTGNLAFEVNNGAGQTLIAPPGYTLSAEAVLSDGSRTSLTTADGRLYRGQIMPVQSGLQDIAIEIKSRDSNGKDWQTFRGIVGKATIASSTGLTLEILEPSQDAVLPARTPQLESSTLTVTLALKDEKGNVIDAAQAMTGGPVALEIRDSKGRPLSVPTTLVEIAPGRFQGVIDNVGAGDYELVAQITGQPRCGYHIVQPGQVSQVIRRAESPLIIGFYVGGPLALLALIAGIIAYIRYDHQRKAHPCKGRIVIVDQETGGYIVNFVFPSGKQRRNRFVYKGKKLKEIGVKALEHFSQAEFTCTNQQDSDEGIVNARILDLGGDEILDAELRPSKTGRSTGKRLGKTKLYIYKDPMDR